MVEINPTQPSANPVINEPAPSQVQSATKAVVTTTGQIQSSSTKKIVLMGPDGSGKTTWFHKVRTGEFRVNYMASVGVEINPIEVTSTTGETTTFQVWDTAGSEKLTVNSHYIDAHGFVLLFDIHVNDNNNISCGLEFPLFLFSLKNHADSLGGNLPRVVFAANKSDIVTAKNAELIDGWSNGFRCMLIEFGLTDFHLLTMSVKDDSVEDLLTPLMQFV